MLLLFMLVVRMFSPIYFWRVALVNVLSPAESRLADLCVAVSELKGAPRTVMAILCCSVPAVLKREKFGAL